MYFQLSVTLADEHKLIYAISMQASEPFTEFHRGQINAIRVFLCFCGCATKKNPFTILANANQNCQYSASRRKRYYWSLCLSESMCDSVLQRHLIFLLKFVFLSVNQWLHICNNQKFLNDQFLFIRMAIHFGFIVFFINRRMKFVNSLSSLTVNASSWSCSACSSKTSILSKIRATEPTALANLFWFFFPSE